MNNNTMKCTETDAAATSQREDISCGYNSLANAADKLEKNCDEMADLLAEIKGNLRELKKVVLEIKKNCGKLKI